MADEPKAPEPENPPESRPAPQARPEAQLERVCYIGPAFAAAGLPRPGPVYLIGIPQAAKDLYGECPALQGLFIEHDGAGQALRDLKTLGSAAAARYAAVSRYLQNRKNS